MTKIFNKFKNMSPALKASIAYTICSILQKCLSFFTMPLFTRMLTTEQYGQYGVYTSWSSLFSILITLNLAYGSFSNAMMKFKDDRKKYIASIQSIALFLSLLFLIIYLPLTDQINSFLSMPTHLVLVLIGEVLFQFGLLCWFGKNRYEYKYKQVVGVTILTSFFAPLLAYIYIINASEKGYAMILGYATVNIVAGLALFVYNYINARSFFKKEYVIFALRFNLPLLAYYISQMIFNSSDKIMIEKLIGIDQSALYSVAHNLALILTFVLNAINNSYVPWLYEKFQNNKARENRKISIYIIILMCTLVGGIIWISPELISIMAAPEYKEAVYVIPPIACSLIVLLYTQYAVNIQFYYGKKIGMIISSMLAAVMNIVLNYVFIPKFGYIAAGYTTLASHFIFSLFNYIFIIKYLKKRGQLNGAFNFWLMLILLCLFFGLSYAGVALYDYPIVRYSIIGSVIFALIVIAIIFIIKKNKGVKEHEVAH